MTRKPPSLTRALLVKTVRKTRKTRVQVRNYGARITAGRNFSIYPDAIIARHTTVSVGNNVSVGPRATISAHLEVGDDVMISGSVAMVGDDHPFDESSTPITQFEPRPLAKIVIEGDSLIGFGAIIIGPLTIGQGAVIGAGSVVTRDVPPGAVMVGSPASIVKMRRPKH